MEVNWPIVVVRTKALFKQRLSVKQYWTRRKCYELFLACYDEAAMEVADRYAENVAKDR